MTKSLKNVKNEKYTLQDLEYGEKTEKKTENEKYTLQDVKYGEETEKGGKFTYVHFRTWNMARKLKIMENEKHALDDLKNYEITEKRENEKCTLQDL